MASIKFKNALGVERGFEEGFGGIDSSAAQKATDSLSSLVNLLPAADGSLRLRPGYCEKLTLSAPLRASFSVGEKFYALAGSKLTLTDTESGETTLLAEVATTSGTAEIFRFGGELYVHDSEKLYRYDGNLLSECDGYAPLYGKNWHAYDCGEVFEDINLVSDRIRISYLVSEGDRNYNIGIRAVSLERIEVDGKEYGVEENGITLKDNTVRFTNNIEVSDGQIVTLWLTIAPEYSKRHLISKPVSTFVFSNSGGERLCMYSSGESSELLCSLAPSKQEISESRKSSASSSPLYFSSENSIRIGNGGYPITGMAHHFDRALLFTDANTWCVDFEGEEADPKRIFPKIFLLNSAIGFEGSGSTAYCQNDPLTYYRGRLFRWHSQSGVRDECSADMISEPVSHLIPKDGENLSMLSIPHMGLVLISDSESDDGRIIVYSTERKAWTQYSGIFAERLFLFGTYPAFSRSEKIYVFDDKLKADFEDGEEFPIEARLVSHFTDFGCPELTKRSVRILINGELGEDATLELENEIGEKRKIGLLKTGGDLSERLTMPRFKKLRYTIESRDAICLENIILSAK
ncbi:MAG: hypothetical protein IJD70_03115 [Clostridia bacterium]|nr:hypothetical protein [Clostridia bacterium]